MQIKFERLESNDPDLRFQKYQFIMSIISVAFIISIISVLAPNMVLNYLNINEGTFLDSFIVPIAVTVMVISLFLFFKTFTKGTNDYTQEVTNRIKENGEIDQEFPILSSTKILAEKVVKVNDLMDGLFVSVMLLNGWLILVLPASLIFYLFDWIFELGTLPLNLLQILIMEIAGLLLIGTLSSIMRKTREIQFLSNILKQVEINNDEEPEVEEN